VERQYEVVTHRFDSSDDPLTLNGGVTRS